jgi:uncharacterized membrane protein
LRKGLNWMKRTVLLRLVALLVAIAAVVVVAAIAYHVGTTHASGTPVMRGMPFRGYVGGMGYSGSGFGLLGLVGFVLVGLLFVWLLAALLSPDRGGPRAIAPAAGDLDRLHQLSELHDQGKLTDDEFTAAKRKLLGL